MINLQVIAFIDRQIEEKRAEIAELVELRSQAGGGRRAGSHLSETGRLAITYATKERYAIKRGDQKAAKFFRKMKEKYKSENAKNNPSTAYSQASRGKKGE